MIAQARLIAMAAAGLSAGALAAYAAPAAAQSAPAGSYAASCSVDPSAGGYISGFCQTSDGGRRWSSLRYVDCYGDISNSNGVLACRGATATEGPYYPPENTYPPAADYPAATQGRDGSDVLEALAGAIFGSVFGGQTSGSPLYSDGYRYPEYGQSGYGDPRYDPRYGSDGWGYGRDRQWVPISDRGTWFERRISAGRLSDSERRSLTTEFRRLVDLERDNNRGGLSQSERVDLDRRFDQLAARIRIERRDDDGWGGGDWRSISDRRTDFERTLEQGVRASRLTRNEADWLRRDFDALVRREAEASRDGLDRYERQSLDSGFADLILRTGADADGGVGGWTPISSRSAELERAIEEGRRSGRFSRYEADRFRTEMTELLRQEATYQRDGLSDWERQDLTRRYDDLARRIGVTSGGGTGWPTPGASDWPVASQRTDLSARIDRAERDRRINRTEATRMRTELDELLRLEEGYASDGLSQPERDYLRYRIDALSVLVPR